MTPVNHVFSQTPVDQQFDPARFHCRIGSSRAKRARASDPREPPSTDSGASTAGGHSTWSDEGWYFGTEIQWCVCVCVSITILYHVYTYYYDVKIYNRMSRYEKNHKEPTIIKVRRSPHQIAWQNTWITSMLQSSNPGSTVELPRSSKRFPSKAKFKDVRKQWGWFKTMDSTRVNSQYAFFFFFFRNHIFGPRPPMTFRRASFKGCTFQKPP